MKTRRQEDKKERRRKEDEKTRRQEGKKTRRQEGKKTRRQEEVKNEKSLQKRGALGGNRKIFVIEIILKRGIREVHQRRQQNR